MGPFVPYNTLRSGRGILRQHRRPDKPGWRSDQIDPTSEQVPGRYARKLRSPLEPLEPASKRRKVEKLEEIDNSEEGEDELGMSSVRKIYGKNSSITGHGHTLELHSGGSQEYHTVENIMRSDDYVRAKQSQATPKRSRSRSSDKVEVVSESLITNGDKGLHAFGKKTPQGAMERRSHYFTRPQPPDTTMESSSPDLTMSPTRNKFPTTATTISGFMKSSSSSSMGEEAGGPAEYEEAIRVSSDGADIVMGPVRIKPTNSRRLPPKSGKGNLSNTYPITSIAFCNLSFDDDDMQLVFGESSGLFNLVVKGATLPDLAFSVSKIQKVRSSDVNFGTHIRLEMSNDMARPFDDSKVDILCRGEKSFTTLVNKLQESRSGPKVVYHKGEYMEKAFKKRRTQLSQHRELWSLRTESAPDDIKWIEKKKRQSEADLTGTTFFTGQRKPQRRKLISGLQRDAEATRSNASRDTEETTLQAGYPRKKLVDDSSADKEVQEMEGTFSKALTYLEEPRRSTRSRPSLVDSTPALSRYSVENGLGAPWKRPLVYPRTGKRRATVDFEDLIRLDEGECLNDNLIEFALRDIALRLEAENPEAAKKIYWFNSYFYESLTKQGQVKGGLNYDSVKKWTRSIDIFSYDYVVVPINELFHWYVVIICNLPFIGQEQRSYQVEKTEIKSPKQAEAAEVANTDHGVALATPQSPTLPDNTVRPQEIFDDAEARQSFSELRLEDCATTGGGSESPLHVRDTPETNKYIKSTYPEQEMQQSSEAQLQRELQVTYEPEQDSQPEPSADLEPSSPNGRVNASAKLLRSAQRKKKAPPPRVYDPREPAIMTLDSMGHPHPGTCRTLKTYLKCEAKDKKGDEDFGDGQVKGITAKGIPQQDNFHDCGLYLIGYMEKFAQNPSAFVESLLQRKLDAERDWDDLKPNNMRSVLRDKIFQLHREQKMQNIEQKTKNGVAQRKVSSAIGLDGNVSSEKDVTDLNSDMAESETPQRPQSEAADVAVSRSSPPFTEATLTETLKNGEFDLLKPLEAVPESKSKPESPKTPRARPKSRENVAFVVLDSQESAEQNAAAETFRPSEGGERTIGSSPDVLQMESKPRGRGKPKGSAKNGAGQQSGGITEKVAQVVIPIDDI